MPINILPMPQLTRIHAYINTTLNNLHGTCTLNNHGNNVYTSYPADVCASLSFPFSSSVSEVESFSSSCAPFSWLCSSWLCCSSWSFSVFKEWSCSMACLCCEGRRVCGGRCEERRKCGGMCEGRRECGGMCEGRRECGGEGRRTI